ncbi:hypothetical protein SYNPS1DRAFT_23363 [Syncephalis pseudoplumigaleata]|uniref:ATP-dependent DNA helicase n=1 Tax=Syncephalis pseudoplumigaleata TaxID=1712513 RepID=A0A4P9YXG3_9FUNG|nr:hypothetical protein SYNPS1DRAFT_23363 [Syncephalis pseudoplumigaleata]|eukprot:RKP24565.1 hypothetical protein SYNPS1DRAFT_23363 [Syncephalis pseudoplumigaleata]
MGRTGRHREGRIVMLLTEGKEMGRYAKSRYMYKNVQRAIMDPDRIRMWPGNPRILPEHAKPRCDFRTIGSAAEQTAARKYAKDPHLSTIEDEEWRRRYYIDDAPTVRWNRFAVRQTRVTPTHRVPHGEHTLGFVRLMYSMDELVLDGDGDVVRDYEALMCRHLLQSDLWQPAVDGVATYAQCAYTYAILA